MALIYDFSKAILHMRVAPPFGRQLVAQHRDFLGHWKEMEIRRQFLHEQAYEQPIQTDRRQTGLNAVYDEHMHHTQQCMMFMAFCLRNQAILPAALEAVRTEVMREGDGQIFSDLTPRALEQNLLLCKTQFFEVSRIAATMLTPFMIERRIRNSKPFDFYSTFVESKPRDSDFNDWVEHSFWQEYNLPLDVFPRKAEVDKRIKNAVHSMNYAQILLQRFREGLLHQLFPALTLDAPRPEHAQLKDVYKLLHAHVPSFTPSKATFDFHHHPASAQRP
jgi:hypothetical protein